MASSTTAHKIDQKVRTGDVLIKEEVDFSGLFLSPKVLQGLSSAGFVRPSPIQLKAIPLGRCGLDLIVQAKSGTGKTCVFTVLALESVMLNSPAVQVLVLAPTREIALQIHDVITSVGAEIKQLQCYTFIGGMPLNEDRQKLKKCHIAVGSPGRIKQLIEEKILVTDSIRLFILDEADKLLEESFQDQINWIYSMLPTNKQMLALSATYPEYLAEHLTRYMRNPTFMRLNTTDPALLGIKQYYKVVPYHPILHKTFEEKVENLIDLFTKVSFHQCLLFSNYQTRAQNLCDILNSKDWPAACISGSQDQVTRIQAMSKLKNFHCRVLISTDLTSRGIDAERVNLVINLDLPHDHETYLHRIGRAGRFGSYGVAVTFVAEGKEEEQLRAIEKKCNTVIDRLPDPVPDDLVRNEGYLDRSQLDSVVTTEQIISKPYKTENSVKSGEENNTELRTDTCISQTETKTNGCNLKIGEMMSEHADPQIPSVTSKSLKKRNELEIESTIVKRLDNMQLHVSTSNGNPNYENSAESEKPIEYNTFVTDKNTSPTENPSQTDCTTPELGQMGKNDSNIYFESDRQATDTLHCKVNSSEHILFPSFSDAVKSYEEFLKNPSSASVTFDSSNSRASVGDNSITAGTVAAMLEEIHLEQFQRHNPLGQKLRKKLSNDETNRESDTDGIIDHHDIHAKAKSANEIIEHELVQKGRHRSLCHDQGTQTSHYELNEFSDKSSSETSDSEVTDSESESDEQIFDYNHYQGSGDYDAHIRTEGTNIQNGAWTEQNHPYFNDYTQGSQSCHTDTSNAAAMPWYSPYQPYYGYYPTVPYPMYFPYPQYTNYAPRPSTTFSQDMNAYYHYMSQNCNK